MGSFHVVRREYHHRHLWTISVDDAKKSPAAGSPVTEGDDFSVGDLDWSPDGTAIAFSAAINPDLIHRGTTDLYVVDLADKTPTKIVSQAGPDSSPRWSPDGRHIVFSTSMEREPFYALNNELAVVPASGGDIRVLTASFDERPRVVAWNEDGVYFWAFQKTASHLFRIEPATGAIERLSAPDDLMADSFTFSRGGRHAAFVSITPTSLREVRHTSVAPFSPRTLTDSSEQISELELGSRELISWKSEDGTEIEGVLIKPADFDPNVKHPLLCVIHGGPTGIDRPYFRETRTYPVDIWAARGALILKVNYRGSAGYGEAFRTLNVRNLGVGDAWDVLSGVEHLIDQGWVDPERVGCMGWSQGGYISAFLTASTDR
ncbi:MAG: prolyl oligopeptidase family serine peptidase, partial [Acidobacteriota bacterium]|nr:prolyl oligopeptidase family serine peptidase [Acidobacteriota bacterium]